MGLIKNAWQFAELRMNKTLVPFIGLNRTRAQLRLLSYNIVPVGSVIIINTPPNFCLLKFTLEPFRRPNIASIAYLTLELLLPFPVDSYIARHFIFSSFILLHFTMQKKIAIILLVDVEASFFFFFYFVLQSTFLCSITMCAA